MGIGNGNGLPMAMCIGLAGAVSMYMIASWGLGRAGCIASCEFIVYWL
jgi:hypothetical protein